MNLALDAPLVLLLLPLAALPLLFSAQRAQGYPSLDGVGIDPLSRAVEWGIAFAGAVGLAALILGLGGLHLKGQSVERTGKGAHIVLLVDRSSSMDNSFAGRQPAGGEISKSAVAKALLREFVADREHDRFGVAAFSTAPFHVLPLTDHKEAVLAAIGAIDRPGLAFTDVGRGLALALAIHEMDAAAASRAIVLVSDGAAVIDRKTQDRLRQGFAKRRANLYWLYLRSAGSPGIHDQPKPDEEDSPQALPERHLHKFLQTLGVPYRAFEAEDPGAIAQAIAEIDKLERQPIRYVERIPREDLAGWAYAVAAAMLGLLLAVKLGEVGLVRAAVVFIVMFAVLDRTEGAHAAEFTRDHVLEIIANAAPAPATGLSRRDLSGLDLTGVDFRGADLFAADLSLAHLTGANLSRTNLDRCVLREANLAGANLTGASLYAVVLNGADLTGADLSGARIIGEAKNARFSNAILRGADLGADPANQGMSPARLDLSNAVLDGADLTQSNLTHVLLGYANLKGTVLSGARLNWAKLAGADLEGADVAGADFTGADLEGASLGNLAGVETAVGLASPGATGAHP